METIIMMACGSFAVAFGIILGSMFAFRYFELKLLKYGIDMMTESNGEDTKVILVWSDNQEELETPVNSS